MLWNVPRIWNGECFIIGGGPSINLIDIEKLRSKRVIGTNNAYEIAPFIDFLYFMDCVWYKWHKEKLVNFRGIKVTTCHECDNIKGIKFLKTGDKTSLDDRPEFLARGNNAGMGALALAVKLGAKRIILLGYDMYFPNGESNYHNDHQREVKEERYEEFNKKFEIFKSGLKERGVEVLNATPGSKLKLFPIVEPNDVL